MDYGSLKTAIQDYCQNAESTFVAHINDFIIAAEDKVFAAVELPSLWKSTTLVDLSVGVAEYAIGQGVVDILSVRIAEDATPSTADYGPVRYLIQKDYDFLLEAYPGTSSALSTGVPKYYGISFAALDSSEPDLTIRLGPAPNATYPMTTTYYGKTSSDSVTSGSVEGNTTWLSVTFPDVLLYGSLVQAYTFMKGEPDLIQLYEKQFTEGVALVKNLAETRQESDSYRPGMGAPMPPAQQ
tara:strand:+ start:12485 stop:13204 length:720 start_codon:yes stop_codon:yes gene_type:complete